ncbi:hypothetical protein [Heyndrickxia acidiproducens]|nr:hypothetical protein [Heyndrickxia acidiproducens]
METWFYHHVVNTLYFVLFMFFVPVGITALLCYPEIKNYFQTRKQQQS